MFEESKVRLAKNFHARNINVEFFNSLEDCKGRIMEVVSDDKSIGIGNSVTLKKMNISKILSDRGNVVYDKTLVTTKDESKKLKKCLC